MALERLTPEQLDTIEATSQWLDYLPAVLAHVRCLEAENQRLLTLVSKQAEDEGLWFVALTAPEAYLQQELRKLHAAIEDAALTGEPYV